MADSFGLKIGLEGEKDFKKALSEINQSFKVLGSEMKVVSSQFDKNDNSVQALTARNQCVRDRLHRQNLVYRPDGAGRRPTHRFCDQYRNIAAKIP